MQELRKAIAISLNDCNNAICSLRQQNLFAGLGSLNCMTQNLIQMIGRIGECGSQLLELGYQMDEEGVIGMLQGVVASQEQEDFVLTADLIELQVKPFLLQLQEVLITGVRDDSIDEELYHKNVEGIRARNHKLAEQIEACCEEEGYVLEPTSSGHITLLVQDSKGQRYFHSNANPIAEADVFAKQYYSSEFSHYVMYGLGLGYHLQAMLAIDDGIYMDIIERDLQVIRIACQSMDLEWLYSNPRIELHYDQDHKQLGSLLSEEKSLVIHYPSMRHIEEDKLRLQLEKYFISDSGKRNFRIQFDNNFRDNLENCDGYVDDLADLFEGKNAIIVAAGPSLDKNVELLKQKPKNTIVVAVGTVFRKLIEMGIVPDCVVVLDAQPHLYKQIEGLEKQAVPLLCGATVCKQIPAQYEGKKYLVCQKGYPKAEQYAMEKGYRTYETGGSVSTIALDICIQMGCKNIAFIGLDLAFTDGLSHASATADEHAISEQEGNIVIKAYDGGEVVASHLFVMYREWIERRVAKLNGQIPVYDATEGGAYKNGLLSTSLKALMKKWEVVE